MPILKWKRGEQLALKALGPRSRDRILPLVEVQDRPFDWEREEEGAYAKSWSEHLDSVVAATAKYWGTEEEIAVDQPLDDGDTVEDASSAWAFLFESLWSLGVVAIPVISSLASPREIREIRYLSHSALSRAPGRFVLRYRSRSEEGEKSSLLAFSKWLRAMAVRLQTDHSNIDVVLDVGYIGGEARESSVSDDMGSMCAEALFDAALQGPWRSLTLAAGAFPENLAGMRPGVARLPRRDWQFFRRVSNASKGNFRLSYGDYGISYTDVFEGDPRMMRMSANLRYTHFDHWYVYKARSVKDHGFGQYRELCEILVSADDGPFMGASFSAGDQNLALLAADPHARPGNATSWRRDATNHHIELVVHQLRKTIASG